VFDWLTRHWRALLIPVLVLPQGCATAHYTIHPGSVNRTDSVAYDSLLVAETIIDQARAANVPSKDALNALIRAYNLARVSWLAYRDAFSTGMPIDAYAARLAANLAELAKAVRVFRGAPTLKRKEEQ
jgi:hypothetical protein